MYDVCVIGSGAGGGSLAKELAEAGAKVVRIEAGRMPTPRDFYAHQYEFRKRVKPTYAPFAPPDDVRYENSDSIHFNRTRAVGGQTNYWNAVSLSSSAPARKMMMCSRAVFDALGDRLEGVGHAVDLKHQVPRGIVVPYQFLGEQAREVEGLDALLDVLVVGRHGRPLLPSNCSGN
jgi:flavin-dependent dehydrogenase